MAEKTRVIVCGGGPHCKVVLDVLLRDARYEVCGILDDAAEPVLGVPVLGGDALLPALYGQGIRHAFVGIGRNHIREKVSQRLQALGFTLINVISPSANLSPFCTLGSGVFVNHGATVNACAAIGDGCIINTNASVDHDCTVGAYTHVAPGAHVSGSTHIGRQCFLGVGSCVIDYITIGDEVMVGAGAAVVKNIPGHCTAVGVPARVIKTQD